MHTHGGLLPDLAETPSGVGQAIHAGPGRTLHGICSFRSASETHAASGCTCGEGRTTLRLRTDGKPKMNKKQLVGKLLPARLLSLQSCSSRLKPSFIQARRLIPRGTLAKTRESAEFQALNTIKSWRSLARSLKDHGDGIFSAESESLRAAVAGLDGFLFFPAGAAYLRPRRSVTVGLRP